MAISIDSEVRSLDRLPPDAGESGTARRILEAGLELFSARGYHATSIRDVAELAGVKSASLYSHFSAKEDILGRLVFIGHDVHHRTLLSAMLEAGADPRDQLTSVIRAHVTVHCRYTHLAVVATRERKHLSGSALAPSEALRRRSETLAVEIVNRGIERGLFHVPDYEATLVAIGSMGIAVADWYPDRATALSPEAVADAYARLALRMVGAAPVEP